MSQPGTTFRCEGPTPALPPDLDLTLVSRRPARLREETFRAALAGPIPVTADARPGDRPRASIAVVTFNNLAFTRLCLASVLANTGGPFEVIVVDNGSTDGTADYLPAVAAVNPHVRVVLNATNCGFAAANNQALAGARGEALVLLNNDTIVPPGWLAGLGRHLQDPAVGLVGPVTNRIGNEAEIETAYRTYVELLEFACRNGRENDGRAFDIPVPCMFCLALRRDVYDRVGPLDERYGIGMFEDDDYALRTREAGYRLLCAEDVFVHHFGQASFGGLAPTGEYGRAMEANRRQFEEKWGRPWRPHARRPRPAYESLKGRIGRLVAERVPAGATVLVVSKGDEAFRDLLEAEGRTAWHFPQAADGGYAGHYPADSAAAVAHLEDLRRRGADYLLIPDCSAWWLDYYREWQAHLQGHYWRVDDAGEGGVLYRLRGEPGAKGGWAARVVTYEGGKFHA